MSSFHQVLIGGYPSGGLMTDRKPLLLPDQAYSALQNAYVWRERTKKRVGTVGMGQLSRVYTDEGIGNSPALATWSSSPQSIFSLITTPITETYAQLQAGSVILTDGTDTFTDQGNGILRRQDGNLSSTINYVTSKFVLHRTISTIEAFTADFIYYPNLQVMGICKQDIPTIGIDNTIFFDTTYAYQFTNGGFQELTTDGTTWTAPNNANGTNTNFFWSCNYQGTDPSVRLFFATNNFINTGTFDPIRYYSTVSSAWTDLTPIVANVSSTDIYMFQALILIPYYGRLLALNTFEGTDNSTAVNYFARCRFSQIGDTTGVDSWRSDIFGLGGFLDAPTNETIVSVAFYRNTLIVFFEYSTWQLRYLGEYGLPFIFERISSDFGAVSTFSPVLFDQGVMAISDRGIIQAGAQGVTRLDEQIPETVFSFEIQNNSPDFVHGIRDYEKELVYWNYSDSTTSIDSQVFPNQTLVFNYRNNTWAQFRDSISCFGTGQYQFGVTWDSQTTFWDSETEWDSSDDQQQVDYILSGNQQGFISVYEDQDAATNTPSPLMFAPSLSIYSINNSITPAQLTVPNHNLASGENIYITNAIWSGTDPGINNVIYSVKVVDQDKISLGLWNGTSYVSYNIPPSPTYIGGGYITLLPKMNLVGKDFNPFQQIGKQFKLSYIDFQMDQNSTYPSVPAVTIQLFVNSYLGEQANLDVGNSNMELSNASQQSGFITFVALTNPCQVTSPNHSLQNGAVIGIANVLGTTQINNANYTISVVNSNNFTLNGIDATGWTTYASGPPSGIWNTAPSSGQVYLPGAQYAWYRFYSTQFGQYLRVAITYDDALMNQLSTHQTPMELNGMCLFMKEGGRLVN